MIGALSRPQRQQARESLEPRGVRLLPGRKLLSARPRALVTVLPLAATAAAHITVLRNPFRWDEFVHLFRYVNDGLAALILPLYHGHSLLTSNLVYVPMYTFFAANPAPYYLLALLTHLLNVFLLQRVIVLFTERPWLSAFVAALWGIDPTTRISVGWFAVYGHILVTTLGLLILRDIARLHRRLVELSFWHMFRWSVLLFAATTSFGLGPGLCLGFAVGAVLLLPAIPRRARTAVGLGLLVFAVPVFFLMGPTLQGGRNPLGLSWELVWKGVPLLVGALAHVVLHGLPYLFCLVAYAAASFLLGPFIALEVQLPVGPASIAFGPLQRASGVIALGISQALFIMLVLIAYWLLRGASAERRRLVFGLTVLLLCSYVPVAMRALSAADEVRLHVMLLRGRLHYLGPMLVAMITGCVAGATPAGMYWRPRPRTLTIAGSALVLWIFWSSVSAARLEARLPVTLEPQDVVVERIRALAAKEPYGADVYIRNHAFLAKEGFVNPPFPGWAALFVITFPDNKLEGRRIYFVERRARALSYARRRPDSKLAKLLVDAKPDHPGS